MKKWVISDEHGLGIVSTGGHQPPGAICEAKPDWTVETITFDKENGLVFLDPNKVRAKIDANELHERRMKNKQLVDRIKKMAPTVFYITIAFSVGYFLARILV